MLSTVRVLNGFDSIGWFDSITQETQHGISPFGSVDVVELSSGDAGKGFCGSNLGKYFEFSIRFSSWQKSVGTHLE